MIADTDRRTCNPTAWLSTIPGYWRGRASVRRPGVDVDVWSAEALADHRQAAFYERQAELAEKKERE